MEEELEEAKGAVMQTTADAARTLEAVKKAELTVTLTLTLALTLALALTLPLALPLALTFIPSSGEEGGTLVAVAAADGGRHGAGLHPPHPLHPLPPLPPLPLRAPRTSPWLR